MRCISLRTSTDRQKDTVKEFRKHGIDPLPFHKVDRDNENPGRGCYMSHFECMTQALAADQPHALVFEDDVVFHDVSGTVWKEIAAFIKNHPFDILLLGWCKGGGYRKGMCSKSDRVPGYKHVYRSKCLCTHAVVYSRAFMEYFTKHHAKYPGYEIDDVFAELPNVDMYIVSPELFDQRDVDSTIDDDSVERVFIKP
jgi:hypothetical protein